MRKFLCTEVLFYGRYYENIDSIPDDCSKFHTKSFKHPMKKQVFMIFHAAIATLGCLFLFLGCKTVPEYNFESDPEVDFSAYKTFALMPLPSKIPGADPDLILRIGDVVKSTLENELKSKGYKQVYIDNADFTVNISGKVVPKVDVEDFGYMPYHTYPSAGRWGYHHPYTSGYRDIYVDEYKEGTLIIEIYDASTKKLAWVGWTSTRLSPLSPDPNLAAERVRGVIAAFPAVPTVQQEQKQEQEPQ